MLKELDLSQPKLLNNSLMKGKKKTTRKNLVKPG
jgi:hypothetical protein